MFSYHSNGAFVNIHNLFYDKLIVILHKITDLSIDLSINPRATAFTFSPADGTEKETGLYAKETAEGKGRVRIRQEQQYRGVQICQL